MTNFHLVSKFYLLRDEAETAPRLVPDLFVDVGGTVCALRDTDHEFVSC